MKIKFLSSVFFLLFINSAFAQEGFIIDKDGKRFIVDVSTVELLTDQDRFEYRQPGSDKKNKIDLDDIANANLGEFRIETFTLDKKATSYFIIAETAEKKLVGLNDIHHPKYSSGTPAVVRGKSTMRTMPDKTGTTVNYKYWIIDANNKVIEKLEFTDIKREKEAQKRDEAEAILKNHFRDCPELKRRENAIREKAKIAADIMPVMSKHYQKMVEEVRLLSIFDNPFFSKCNDSANDSVKSTAETREDNSQYDGTYQFESFSIYKPIEMTRGTKGTFILKNGLIDLKSKDYSIQYKIRNIKDGIMYLEDKSMIHSMKIMPEVGKKKGAAYDTKILFTSDRTTGTVTEYWCTKQ